LGSQTYAGQNKTVSLRGGRNRQVLILIDGVRVSDPSRIDNDFDLNFLNLDQIESIEILKGASSTLYGSSAATGVISIQTKKASKGFYIQLGSSLGSEIDQDSKRNLSLFKNNIHLSHGGEKFSAKAYLSSHLTDGMSAVIGQEKDPFALLNLGTSLRYESAKSFDLTGEFHHSLIQSDYDNSFPLEDASFSFVTEMNRVHLSPNFNYKNGGVSLRLGYQNVTRDFRSAFPFQTQAENSQLELFNKYAFGERIYTVVGVLFQQNYADYEGGQTTSQNDVFANVVGLLTDRMRINMGGRLNSHSTYGNQFTYSVNPSYTLVQTPKFSLKGIAALSSAFIAPSLYQLYDPFSGNIDLDPEENQSFESGFFLKLYDWEFTTTYFQRKENPSLIYDLATYRYGNSTSEAFYQGVEMQFLGKVSSRIKWNSQITFTETENGDLRYLPKWSSQSELSYSISNDWSMNLSLQTIGKRFGLDNTTVLDSYELMNLSIVHQLKKTPLRIVIHATNIFNTNFIEIEGYATRGRNFVAGITYRFP
jgi:vitamin B12 transporter